MTAVIAMSIGRSDEPARIYRRKMMRYLAADSTTKSLCVDLGRGGVSITGGDHLALGSDGALEEVEELGIAVLVRITAVAGVGLDECLT